MESSRSKVWRGRVNRGRSRLTLARSKVSEEKTSLETLKERLRVLEEATVLAQGVASRIQSKASDRIAEVVTKCLAIFEEPYRFLIKFDRKRGRTEARLVFERDGLEVNPLTASGGGVVDVAGFALRVACLVLSRPRVRPLLVLDEPMRFLSPEYGGKGRVLIKTLARNLGVQFVIVTHDPRLRAGKIHSTE